MPAGLDDFLFRLGWFLMGIVAAAVSSYALGWLNAATFLKVLG